MRRLLDTVIEALPSSINGTPESPVAGGGNGGDTGAGGGGDDAYLNSSLLVILAALLCTLVCVLALNSIVRCAIRCRRRRFALGIPGAASSTGLKKQALGQIPIMVYGIGAGATITATDCPICLAEFAEGDKIRVLPECHHGFHFRCIDAWLALQSSCPTCRRLVVLDGGGSSEAGDTCSRQDSNDLVLRTES